MPTAVDHLEAALARITREDIADLPPARRERLKAQLGAWACLCDELVQPRLHPEDNKNAAKKDEKQLPQRFGEVVRPGSSAAEGICPTCGEATEPGRPTCADAMCKAEFDRYVRAVCPAEPQRLRSCGVVARLNRGERSS